MTHLSLALFLWTYLRTLQAPTSWRKWALAAALSFGWLAMTRVFVGHVITVMIFASAGLFVFRSARMAAWRSLCVMVLALLLCAPYLRYTYQKTGSYFLWSTSAGELFYWLSSHEGGENGHWYHESEVYARPELAVNHAEFFTRIKDLGPLEREHEFKAVAKKRIQENPIAFMKNWVCNVCRLFFGFPRSLEVEKLTTLPLVMFNGLLLLGLLAGLALAYLRWQALSSEVWLLLLMAVFYTGGSTLAPALPRYFLGAVPVIALVAAALLARVPWANLWRGPETVPPND
jgi:Ca2+/Na+ antiporter